MDVVTVCPFCMDPASPRDERVQDPTDPHSYWHRACWLREHAAEPVDFAGYERGDREAAWLARGGKRGAGL